MKVVILAGGFGTRLSEFTDIIPKPMVRIGSYPILFHIMSHYASYGFKDFIIALGYKSEVIKDYFLNFYNLNSDISINLNSGNIEIHNSTKIDWKVTLVDTGIDSMTGGRLLKVKKYLSNDEPFLLTYGDGLSDINIHKLVEFHAAHDGLCTVTSVRPIARFGELDIGKDHRVDSFFEKPSSSETRINGGFFVMNKGFIDKIKSKSTILEKDPLMNSAKEGSLFAYNHDGFWKCMDTKRDLDELNEIWEKKEHKWNFFS